MFFSFYIYCRREQISNHNSFEREKGKKYRSLKFRKLLYSISDKSTDEQNKLIEQEFNSWLCDYEQIDDVCVMGVRIT